MMDAIRNAWRTLFRGWMRFAHVLGIVNTTLLLTILFVLVVIPTRFLWWLVRKDPLVLRRSPFVSGWVEREQDVASLDERRHPF